MTAKGSPRENAQAESFFRTLKHEEVYLSNYQTYDQAERSLRRFINDVYNSKRLHSSLGYLPPDELEGPRRVSFLKRCVSQSWGAPQYYLSRVESHSCGKEASYNPENLTATQLYVEPHIDGCRGGSRIE
jgi:hypothetical protein